MKKSEVLLKAGIFTIAAFTWFNTAHAQQVVKNPGRKDVAVSKTVPVQKSNTTNQISPVTNGVAKGTLNSNLAAQKRGAFTPNNGSAQRNCTTKPNLKPYSITREIFDKLPKDRQEFVMSNPDKYSVID